MFFNITFSIYLQFSPSTYEFGLNMLDSWKQCVAIGCEGRFNAWFVGTLMLKLNPGFIAAKRKEMDVNCKPQ